MEDFPVLCVFSENSDLRKLKGDALHFPAGMHCQGSRGRGVVRGEMFMWAWDRRTAFFISGSWRSTCLQAATSSSYKSHPQFWVMLTYWLYLLSRNSNRIWALLLLTPTKWHKLSGSSYRGVPGTGVHSCAFVVWPSFSFLSSPSDSPVQTYHRYRLSGYWKWHGGICSLVATTIGGPLSETWSQVM